MQNKITLATFKSFIRKNRAALHVLVKTKFDGMTDGCESTGQKTFSPAQNEERTDEQTLRHTCGIKGVYLVGSSRDYFTAYKADGFTGIEFYNCCGQGVIAIPDAPVAKDEAPAPAAILPFVQTSGPSTRGQGIAAAAVFTASPAPLALFNPRITLCEV